MKTLPTFQFCSAALATILLGISSTTASAIQMVLQPTSVTYSTACCGRVGEHAINGNGLSDATIVQTGDPIPAVWPTHDGNPGLMYLSDQIDPATMVFDLGQIYFDVEGFHVWNYNEDSGNPALYTLRGMQSVTVDFSTVSSAGPFSSPIVYTGGTAFAQANGSAVYGGEDKLFPQVDTRWIRFVGSNFTTSTELYVGLSEVRFFTAAPVPEPSTVALLGLGAVGLVVRRRRRRVRT